MGKEIQVVNFEEMAMTPEEIQEQVNIIQRIKTQVMKENVHYMVIPGCDKPSLLKPGAEKICLAFRLAPAYKIRKTELSGGYREYEFICILKHITTSQIVGEGVGLSTAMNSKYRWRNAERVCPKCGNHSIIKGKAQYGGGWLCYKKKDGCGAKFKAGDKQIEGQEVGRIENPDIADQFNTILKMGKKSAYIDAVLTATAASDLFTQDIEDLPKEENTNYQNPGVTQQQGNPRNTQGTPPQPPPPPPPRPQNTQPPPNNPPAGNNVSGMRAAVDPNLIRDAVLKPWANEIGMLEQFLIKKGWLKNGEKVGDLTDGHIKRIADNHGTMMTLYNAWKNSQY